MTTMAPLSRDQIEFKEITSELEMTGDGWYKIDGDVVPSPEHIKAQCEEIRKNRPRDPLWHMDADRICPDNNTNLAFMMLRRARLDLNTLLSTYRVDGWLSDEDFIQLLGSVSWMYRSHDDRQGDDGLTLDEACAWEAMDYNLIVFHAQKYVKANLTSKFVSWLKARLSRVNFDTINGQVSDHHEQRQSRPLAVNGLDPLSP